jgi:hypothetical protein
VGARMDAGGCGRARSNTQLRRVRGRDTARTRRALGRRGVVSARHTLPQALACRHVARVAGRPARHSGELLSVRCVEQARLCNRGVCLRHVLF